MSSKTADPVHGREAERWGGWSWRKSSYGEHFRRCSFCGSIHPEDLAAEAEWSADWADQKYGWPHKFYVTIPNREPQRRYIVGSTNAVACPAGWIRGSDIPGDVDTDGHDDLSGLWVQISTRATHFAKFYSAHLADTRIAPAALERVQVVSGLRFHFENGTVGWQSAA